MIRKQNSRILLAGIVAATLATVIGIGYWRIRCLGVSIRAADEAAFNTVMTADHSALSMACATMASNCHSERSFASRDFINRFGKDKGWEEIGTNVPAVIRALKPCTISLSHDMVSIRLQPLSRATLIYCADQTADLGLTSLTNGLWYFNSEADRRKAFHGQPTRTTIE